MNYKKNKILIIGVLLVILLGGAFLLWGVFQKEELHEEALDYRYILDISPGCEKGRIVSWTSDELVIENIPEEENCFIEKNERKFIELEVFEEEVGGIELSKERGVVASGGLLNFGRVDFTFLGAPSYYPTPYITENSKAQSVTHDEENLLFVRGIPEEGFFGTETDEFISLKIRPIENETDINFSYLQFSGAGNITYWDTKNNGEVEYMIGVLYENEEFFVKLDGEEISQSPVLAQGSPPVISFKNAESGRYSILHEGLIEFEDDMLISLEGLKNDENLYIVGGCKMEMFDLGEDVVIFDGIPENVTCSIKIGKDIVVSITPHENETGYLEFSGKEGIIDSRGELMFEEN